MRYSIFSLARQALNYHKGWEKAWRSPELKPSYDAVIIGAGGGVGSIGIQLAKAAGLVVIATASRPETASFAISPHQRT